MKVAVFKALWGMTGTMEEKVRRIAEAGYDGVEGQAVTEQAGELRRLLERYKLKFVGAIQTQGGTVEEHVVSFREMLARAVEIGPVKVTAQTCRDKFSFEEQVRFYEAALVEQEKYGVEVNHETHRYRAMFTPWTTAALLKRFPKLHICADFSHWTCVCVSLLEDQEENVALAISRTRHIHARVGYEQGPQVTDPAAPEFQRHLERHLEWWDAILEQQRKAGVKVATIDPEFGPPEYMHTMPWTQKPVADLWEICLWMTRLLRERYRN